MPLFNFTNATASSISVGISDDNIISFLNPDNEKYVSATDALKHSDLYSIIFQLASDLATAQFKTDNSINQGMLNNPTRTSNSHAFWMSMFAQLLLDGNAYAYRWRNNNGTDLRWEYLRPSQVSPFLLEDGSGLIYNATFDEPSVGVIQNIPQSDMIHMRLLSTDGGKTGTSPLMALSNEIAIQDQSNKLTISALTKSLINPGVLKVTGGGLLSGNDKSSRSIKFMNQVNNSAGGPIVLDDLEEYTQLEINANVSSLLAQTDWTTKQIAKVYGLSDSAVNGKGDAQSSMDMMANEYVKSLSRFANPAIAELSNKLSLNVTIDLRKAMDPMGSAYISQIANLTANGVLSPNQATWLLHQNGLVPDGLPDPPIIQQGGINDVENN